jgi:hypothetical protein
MMILGTIWAVLAGAVAYALLTTAGFLCRRRRPEPSGFWAHGRKSLRRQLKKEETAAIAKLEWERQEADDPEERARIANEMKRLRRDYRDKRRAVDAGLFVTSGLFVASPQPKSKDPKAGSQ